MTCLMLFSSVCHGSSTCKCRIVKWLIWNVLNHDFLVDLTCLNNIKLNYLDFYFWPQWRNRTRFTLPPKTSIRQNMRSKYFYLNIRQWMLSIHERWKAGERSTEIVWAYCLRGVSRLHSMKPSSLSELKK